MSINTGTNPYQGNDYYNAGASQTTNTGSITSNQGTGTSDQISQSQSASSTTSAYGTVPLVPPTNVQLSSTQIQQMQGALDSALYSPSGPGQPSASAQVGQGLENTVNAYNDYVNNPPNLSPSQMNQTYGASFVAQANTLGQNPQTLASTVSTSLSAATQQAFSTPPGSNLSATQQQQVLLGLYTNANINTSSDDTVATPSGNQPAGQVINDLISQIQSTVAKQTGCTGPSQYPQDGNSPMTSFMSNLADEGDASFKQTLSQLAQSNNLTPQQESQVEYDYMMKPSPSTLPPNLQAIEQQCMAPMQQKYGVDSSVVFPTNAASQNNIYSGAFTLNLVAAMNAVQPPLSAAQQLQIGSMWQNPSQAGNTPPVTTALVQQLVNTAIASTQETFPGLPATWSPTNVSPLTQTSLNLANKLIGMTNMLQEKYDLSTTYLNSAATGTPVTTTPGSTSTTTTASASATAGASKTNPAASNSITNDYHAFLQLISNALIKLQNLNAAMQNAQAAVAAQLSNLNAQINEDAAQRQISLTDQTLAADKKQIAEEQKAAKNPMNKKGMKMFMKIFVATLVCAFCPFMAVEYIAQAATHSKTTWTQQALSHINKAVVSICEKDFHMPAKVAEGFAMGAEVAFMSVTGQAAVMFLDPNVGQQMAHDAALVFISNTPGNQDKINKLAFGFQMGAQAVLAVAIFVATGGAAAVAEAAMFMAEAAVDTITTVGEVLGLIATDSAAFMTTTGAETAAEAGALAAATAANVTVTTGTATAQAATEAATTAAETAGTTATTAASTSTTSTTTAASESETSATIAEAAGTPASSTGSTSSTVTDTTADTADTGADVGTSSSTVTDTTADTADTGAGVGTSSSTDTTTSTTASTDASTTSTTTAADTSTTTSSTSNVADDATVAADDTTVAANDTAAQTSRSAITQATEKLETILDNLSQSISDNTKMINMLRKLLSALKNLPVGKAMTGLNLAMGGMQMAAQYQQMQIAKTQYTIDGLQAQSQELSIETNKMSKILQPVIQLLQNATQSEMQNGVVINQAIGQMYSENQSVLASLPG